jgi:hypothetical protein
VGAVIVLPGVFLGIPLAVLAKMGAFSPPDEWVWLGWLFIAGFCLAAVGLMLTHEDGVLVAAKELFVHSGEKQRLTDDLPVGHWVAITTSSDDGGGDGDGDGDGD